MKEMGVAWWGFNEEDSTDVLQAATTGYPASV